jgi:hypothetical protein
VVLQLHRDLYRYAGETGGRWKSVDNEIMEVRPDGTKIIRFQPVSAFATPEAMAQLHVRFNELWWKGEVEKLVLVPTYSMIKFFVLDVLLGQVVAVSTDPAPERAYAPILLR